MQGKRLAADGSDSARPAAPTLCVRVSQMVRSRAVGIISVSRRARLRELTAAHARPHRSLATAVLIHKGILAVTISLARQARTHRQRSRVEVRPATAAITEDPAAVDVRHSSPRVIALRPRLTTAHPQRLITAPHRRRTIANRTTALRVTAEAAVPSTAAAAGDRTAVVVDRAEVAAGIPLQVAIAAAEGHDPSLSRSGSLTRVGAALFFAPSVTSDGKRVAIRRRSAKLRAWANCLRRVNSHLISNCSIQPEQGIVYPSRSRKLR